MLSTSFHLRSHLRFSVFSDASSEVLRSELKNGRTFQFCICFRRFLSACFLLSSSIPAISGLGRGELGSLNRCRLGPRLVWTQPVTRKPITICFQSYLKFQRSRLIGTG